MANSGAALDLQAFTRRIGRVRPADPRRVARAGLNMVDNALRIRRSEGQQAVDPADVLGSWLYPNQRPITKPAEAVGAWLKSIASDIDEDVPFDRVAEMREAMIAAGEEVETATQSLPAAQRLRSALYSDALGSFGSQSTMNPLLPWVLALGGVLVGILWASRKKR